ncbi:MAG: sulfatase-like hydrolase/transferase, partial [Massilibacteroides sp.]|nr:sulfatase-like hydrolase/transferase [Massilibacteroides sp.]
HDKPFFLYLPYEACHGPWQGPKDKAFRKAKYNENNELVDPTIGEQTKNKHKSFEESKETYTDMVEALDYCVGRILKAVEQNGLSENTLILFFSDNGGAKMSCYAPWAGWKGSLLEGGQRVSSIAYWPKKIKANQVSDEMILTMDVLPTLCEVTSTPMNGTFDGVSFLQTLIGGKKMPDRTVFWRTQKQVCARQGKWKLLLDRNTQKGQLVDISTDLKEEHDLWKQNPKIASKLLKAMQEWENKLAQIKQFSE